MSQAGGYRTRRRIRRLCLAAAGLCALYLGCFLAATLWPRGGPADIAVVLGNEVLPTGAPSWALAVRLDAAADAYRSGWTKLILVSGGLGASGYDEAAVMRDYLVTAGIPAAAILVDSAGVTTRATARNAAALMRDRHLRSALVVTQYFHVLRCVIAFRDAGVDAVGATYPARFELRDVYSTARELVAIPAYALGFR